MGGFNLPPGCSASDLPGNTQADVEHETLAERLTTLLNDEFYDEQFERILAAVSIIAQESFDAGYAKCQSDVNEAQHEEPKD